MSFITRTDRDNDPSTEGCKYLGGFFLLDDRHPDLGFGKSPFFVFADRALDLPEVEAQKAAAYLRDYYGYDVQVGPMVHELTPRDLILADMKSGALSRAEGVARLRDLAKPA
jgi:hypothetical protein